MSVVLLPPGLYQVSPSNQQNVETTSVIKEYLRIKRSALQILQVFLWTTFQFKGNPNKYCSGEIIIMMTLMLVKPTSYLIGSMIGWMVAGIIWLGGALTSF